MLYLLDKMLRQFLLKEAPGLQVAQPGQPPAPPKEDQVGFDPPNATWRNAVSQMQATALNVYMVELRENRKLRSNERVRVPSDGLIYEQPAPARLDCHYLISAWSPETVGPQLEPTLDEHMLLYQAAAALMREAPLSPSRVHHTNPTPPNNWPDQFWNVDLPTVVAPHEGFPKLAEFWGSMGSPQPWKPVLYLILTVPVGLHQEVAGPMVTTRTTEYRRSGQASPGQVWIQIGGHVLNKASLQPNQEPLPVAGAWVGLRTTSGELLRSTETDRSGQYTFNDMAMGDYELNVSAPGYHRNTFSVGAPSPSGRYDVELTPLP